MVKMLTDEMNHWSENASCNEGIFRTFLSLYTDLYQCKSVHEMVKLLNDSCRDYLFVPYARIWLNEERIDDLMKCDERYLLSLDISDGSILIFHQSDYRSKSFLDRSMVHLV